MAKEKSDSLSVLFDGKAESVRATYAALSVKLERRAGAFGVEAKTTSLHLTHGGAFAGIHPRKNWLDLTIRLNRALSGPRVRAVEQVSRNRWHNEIRLNAPGDVDAALLSWLLDAYALAGEGGSLSRPSRARAPRE